jgi:hypothetical protein
MRFDNFVIEDATTAAIEITSLYHTEHDVVVAGHTPVFRNLAFSNLTIVNAGQVASIEGLPEQDLEQLRFTDITASGTVGIVCRRADDVELRGVRVEAKSGGPFVLAHVRNLRIDGVPQPDVP